jgi:hypothetical protein
VAGVETIGDSGRGSIGASGVPAPREISLDTTATTMTAASALLCLTSLAFQSTGISMFVELLSLIAGTMAIGCFLAIVAEESCA